MSDPQQFSVDPGHNVNLLYFESIDASTFFKIGKLIHDIRVSLFAKFCEVEYFKI